MYLFAPIVHHLKESDFQNYRLENGIKLWQGMWDYRSPNVQCFLAPVKPRARQLVAASQAQSSGENLDEKATAEQHHESPTNTSIFSETPKDDELSFIASPKDLNFPETIPEEASSLEDEQIVLLCLPQGPDPTFYTADASLLHHSNYQTPSSRRSSRSSLHSKDKYLHDRSHTRFDFDKIELFEKKHDEAQAKPKGSSSTERESLDTDIKSPQYKEEQKTYERDG